MSWVGDTIYIASVSGGVYLSVRVAYLGCLARSLREKQKIRLSHFWKGRRRRLLQPGKVILIIQHRKYSVISRVYKRAECGRGIPAISNNLSVSRC